MSLHLAFGAFMLMGNHLKLGLNWLSCLSFGKSN